MDNLIEDYDANLARIEQLAHLLEEYEENSAYFAAFNKSAEQRSTLQSLVQVLLDQKNSKKMPT